MVTDQFRAREQDTDFELRARNAHALRCFLENVFVHGSTLDALSTPYKFYFETIKKGPSLIKQSLRVITTIFIGCIVLLNNSLFDK